MTDPDPGLAPLDGLTGTWDTASTHPQFHGVVRGWCAFEWLDGGHFLVIRSHNEHELFPDAILVVGPPGAGEGLVGEYFDARGVRHRRRVADVARRTRFRGALRGDAG